jgi:hypothetical protein
MRLLWSGVEVSLGELHVCQDASTFVSDEYGYPSLNVPGSYTIQFADEEAFFDKIENLANRHTLHNAESLCKPSHYLAKARPAAAGCASEGTSDLRRGFPSSASFIHRPIRRFGWRRVDCARKFSGATAMKA